MKLLPLMIFLLLLLGAVVVLGRRRRTARAGYIRSYRFPPGLTEKLRQRRPELSALDCENVERGLRQFFLAYLNSGCRFVSMPSQAADDLWHEFILYTRHYQLFCNKAFGKFMHHTPAVALSRNRRDNAGLRRVWWQCCKEEHIDPRNPRRLPFLFALDGALQIADGFIYTPDCRSFRSGGNNQGGAYCGGDFSSNDFDGATDGFGDGGDSGDGGGDGGCGGGCGGGD